MTVFEDGKKIWDDSPKMEFFLQTPSHIGNLIFAVQALHSTVVFIDCSWKTTIEW